MIPVISIVGEKWSGKTRLIEKLVRELKRRGYRVGTIKHTLHQFEIDRPGTDSYRHFQAGADVVAISSPRQMALMERWEEERGLDELVARYFPGVNLVLTEGYRGRDKPKIEIVAAGANPSCTPKDNLIAVVGHPSSDLNLPHFRPDDYESIADFLEGLIRQTRKKAVTLLVNGRNLPLNPFVTGLFKEIIGAMVRGLKGGGEAQVIELRVDNRQ